MTGLLNLAMAQPRSGRSSGFSPGDLAPVFWIDAAQSPIIAGKVKNLGSGGAALDATLGSVAGANIYGGALNLPGIATNNVSVPDATPLDISGDMQMIMRLAADDWSPGSQQTFMAKQGGAGFRSFAFYMTAGAFGFTGSNDGTAFLTGHTSGTTAALVDGTIYWVRQDFDADNGAAGRTCTFYYAPDAGNNIEPTVWTPLGSPSIQATVASFFNSTQTLEIGSVGAGTTQNFAGKVYRAILRNGLPGAGTTVLDIDFTTQPNGTTQFRESSSNTALVTLLNSADTNEPTKLSGTGYLYLPGISGNNCTTPDDPSLDVTGDIEFVARVNMDDWTPAAVNTWMGKSFTDPNRSYFFSVRTNGALAIDWFPTGSAASNLASASTLPVPALDGQILWIKGTLDVDNGAGGNTARFFYAPDVGNNIEPTSWTPLGIDVVTAGVTSIPNTTAVFGIGAQGAGGGNPSTGKIYRAILRNGIGGTTVLDVDFSKGITSGGQTSFVCDTGQTVSINRASGGKKTSTVVRDVFSLGLDDYLEIPDNALLNFAANESFSVVWVGRQFATNTNFGALVAKALSTALSTGWVLCNNGTTPGRAFLEVRDGAIGSGSSALAGTYTPGNLTVLTGIRDVGADRLRHYNNAVVAGADAAENTTATLTNTEVMRIGRYSGASVGYTDIEVAAVLLFRRVLTAQEVAQLTAYYGAS